MSTFDPRWQSLRYETMRLHLFSDLHLEFGPVRLSDEVRTGALADLVLLAGDIDVKRRAVAWAAATFSQPVCLIGGNHEVYKDSLFANIAASRKAAKTLSDARTNPVRFLEQETWAFRARDGTPVRVAAATFWTDFQIFGVSERDRAMVLASRMMNDFELIRVKDEYSHETRKLHPMDVVRINAMSKRFLQRTLAESFDGITIVMTHYAPSLKSVPVEYRGDLLTAAYASDEESMIEQFQPSLWVHGHVHSSSDYQIGRTRVVCNPRGYAPNDLNPAFDPALTIEL